MRKIAITLITTVLITSLIGLYGCNKTYSSKEICKEFITAVVEIQVRNNEEQIVGNATGTVIDGNGLILTNRHVVRGYDYTLKDYIYYENFYVRFCNEEEFTKAELIKYSDKSDLAVLKTEKKVDKYFKLGSEETLSYGEVVHTIGNGNGYGLAYEQGYVAAPLRIVKYEEENIEAIQLSLTINEGNSGGPLINSKGELIGITTFRLRDKSNNVIYGTCFALPVKTINSFLNTL